MTPPAANTRHSAARPRGCLAPQARPTGPATPATLIAVCVWRRADWIQRTELSRADRNPCPSVWYVDDLGAWLPAMAVRRDAPGAKRRNGARRYLGRIAPRPRSGAVTALDSVQSTPGPTPRTTWHEPTRRRRIPAPRAMRQTASRPAVGRVLYTAAAFASEPTSADEQRQGDHLQRRQESATELPLHDVGIVW